MERTDVIRDLTGVESFSVDAEGKIALWPEGVPQPTPEEIDAHEPVWAAKLEAGRIERAWGRVRAQRAPLLTGSDWTQIADAPLGPNQREAWAAYRQSLRDVTKQADPEVIVWPVAP